MWEDKRKENNIFNLDMFLPKHPLIKVTMFVLMIDKIEILEAISRELLKVIGFVTYFSSHFYPIWVDEKSGPEWMLHPSLFSSFLSYNLNQTRDIVMSVQFPFFSLLILHFQTKCKF